MTPRLVRRRAGARGKRAASCRQTVMWKLSSEAEMNRVVLTFDERGQLVRACAEFGTRFVQEEIGGYPIGRCWDDIYGRLLPDADPGPEAEDSKQ